MLLGRILGWLLVALALLALGGDGLRWLESGRLVLIGLGDFWRFYDPATLALLERLLPPAVWDSAMAFLLALPAALVLGATGVVLLLVFRKRPPKRRQRFGALA